MAKHRDPLANSQIYLERNKEPEQKLWDSVLLIAACDALRFKGDDVYMNNDSEAARNWFKNNSVDFRKVCELAGYNSKYVRTKMLKKMREKDEENNMSSMYGKRLYQSQTRSGV
jgi:hypothetical protein